MKGEGHREKGNLKEKTYIYIIGDSEDSVQIYKGFDNVYTLKHHQNIFLQHLDLLL